MDYVTKDDLRVALAPFPTREELRALLALYPTREEMRAEIREALAAYPTREEMRHEIRAATAPLATREEMREEGERTRRHFDVVAESLRGDIRLIAEGYVALDQKIEKVRLSDHASRRSASSNFAVLD